MLSLTVSQRQAIFTIHLITVTLCHVYSSSNMTLVINVNISVWKRRTSECCTIKNMYLHTSNKYIYRQEYSSVLTTKVHDIRLSTTALYAVYTL